MRRPPEGRDRRDRGSAAVEFALVLPLVLLVTLALVQTGLLVRDRLLVEAGGGWGVEAAARAGPRAAAIQDDGVAIRDAAVAAAPGLDAAGFELAVTRAGVRGDPVTVSVRYAAAVRVPLVAWLFGGSVGMSSSTTARQEFG